MKEENSMKLKPLGDKIVLKQLEAEEKTKSGIVLPGTAKEKPQEAEVVAVGPGGVVDGKDVVMQVEVGQKVIYSKYSGTDVKLGDDEFVIVKQSDILAVVEA
jgi:chaperonin GroES